MDKKFFIEAFKYGIVGVGNTLLTLSVIWLMRSVLELPLIVANMTGYVLGFINSFVFNRIWTFKGKDDWKKEFIKYLIVFLICYLIQLGFVLLLENYTTLKETYTTLLGMVVYTGVNFFLNKYYTFKTKS